MRIHVFISLLLIISTATFGQQQTINNGESGLTVRTKINSNFTELYVSMTPVINVSSMGVVSDGVTPVSDQLQEIINNYVGYRIVIGSTYLDVFIIDKSIDLPSYTILEINGTLKSIDGHQILITSNVIQNATSVQVASTSNVRTGQKWVISDDNQPINGGGAWKTRRVGRSFVVSSVVGNTINTVQPFSLAILGSGSFTTAANGKIGEANSIFTISGKTNIRIFGTGTLDGNKANQYNIAPGNPTIGTEDTFASCGIAFDNSTDIIVSGLTIKNFILHGISTIDLKFANTSYDFFAENLIIDGVIDKSIACINLHRFVIDHVINKNGSEEGEIMMYDNCVDGTVVNGMSIGNRRFGVAAVGQSNKNITISNWIFIDNVVDDLYLQNQLYSTQVSNLNFTGTVAQTASILINSSRNVFMSGVQIYGKTGSPILISITANTGILSASDNIKITGLTIKDCNAGSGQGSVAIGVGTRVFLDLFSIDNVYRVFNDASASNGFVKCSRGHIGTYTNALFGGDNNKFLFTQTTGITVENTGTATVASGQTSIVVTHGLTRTPRIQDIRVTPTNSLGNATKWYVTSINSTTFTITVNTDPGATTAIFDWVIQTYMGG